MNAAAQAGPKLLILADDLSGAADCAVGGGGGGRGRGGGGGGGARCGAAHPKLPDDETSPRVRPRPDGS
ncbi:hypothetical protein M0F01_22580, partial [Ralstonia solanacearum]|uniref:hypothetical protein n=1 Tax=Ralstonia solanacearum TaxID=305 RepID=UPI00202A11B5